MPKTEITDLSEWNDLGAKLAVVGRTKYDEVIEALRKIVEAQEVLAQFDWQLLFGERPSKRYLA